MDSAGVGESQSLALDAAGHSVISYLDGGDLALARQVEVTLSETYFLPLAHR